MPQRKFQNLVPCQFLPYSQVILGGRPPEGALWVDVSSYADDPYNTLSPFYAHGGVPIPGLPGKTADSVEGIWQGLKVIRGETAPRFFAGRGRKRGGGKPSGHLFGDQKRLLGIEEARRQIYVPAYEWVLENRVDPALVDEIVGRMHRGVPQFFYDRESNGSLSRDEPLAHASVLVRWLNRRAGAG